MKICCSNSSHSSSGRFSEISFRSSYLFEKTLNRNTNIDPFYILSHLFSTYAELSEKLIFLPSTPSPHSSPNLHTKLRQVLIELPFVLLTLNMYLSDIDNQGKDIYYPVKHLWWSFVAKIVNGWQPSKNLKWYGLQADHITSHFLNICIKSSIIDVWQVFKYTFDGLAYIACSAMKVYSIHSYRSNIWQAMVILWKSWRTSY